jgi:hypothetical protein
MTEITFGTNYSRTSYTDGYVRSEDVAEISSANVADDGKEPIIVTHLSGYIAGRGANRTAKMYVADQRSYIGDVSIAMPGGSEAAYTGLRAISGFAGSPAMVADVGLVSSMTFGYSEMSGECYYGRGSTGTRDTPAGTYTDGLLYGTISYIMVPTVPLLPVGTYLADGVATLSWDAPADDGDTPITGYRIRYSTSSSFTSSEYVNTTTDSTTYTLSNLAGGSTYYFKVYAKNAVTVAASTYSQASASASFVMPPYTAQNFNSPTVFSSSAGRFWSLAGHLNGFTNSGRIVKPKIVRETQAYNLTTTEISETNVNARIHAPSATEFRLVTLAPGGIEAPLKLQFYADGRTDPVIFGSIGNNFSGVNSSVNKVSFKTTLATVPTEISWLGRSGNDYYNQNFLISLKDGFLGSFLKITIGVGDGAGGVTTFGGTDVSITSALFNEIIVTIFYSFNTVDSGTVTVKVHSEDGLTLLGQATQTYTYLSKSGMPQYPLWHEYINGIGFFRSLYMRNGGVVDPAVPSMANNVGYYNAPNLNFFQYENEPTYAADVTNIDFPPAHSVKNNMWSYLQDVCAVTKQEIAAVDDVITVRNVGVRDIDSDDFAGPINLSVATTLTGRQVDINYRESEYLVSGEVYSAFADDNKVLSVKPGEFIQTTLQSNSSLIGINQPFAYKRVVDVPIPDGVYEIMDSTGLPIVADEWLKYGGKLTVAINPDIPGGIDVSLTAPISLIPGTTEPYSISVADGVNNYATLSITGSSIKGSAKTLNLLTGSARSLTTQDIATTITNPFITTIGQAYDAGLMAAAVASGPNVTISGSISNSSMASFGLLAGSLIRYRNNIFRVTSVTIGNLSVSFNATTYVTVDDFYATWGVDATVAGVDYVWDGYQTHDLKLTPLVSLGVNRIYVFGDTDSIPYYSESTLESYSVLLDTDGVPYFDTSPLVAGHKLLYLDNDVVPYYV